MNLKLSAAISPTKERELSAEKAKDKKAEMWAKWMDDRREDEYAWIIVVLKAILNVEILVSAAYLLILWTLLVP